MNLFSKKKIAKATEITDFQLGNMIAVVVDNFQPINGKSVIIKAENSKVLLFKAEKTFEGRAFGTFMIANEIDKEGDFYSEETVKKAAQDAQSMIDSGQKIGFNINHDGAVLKGVFLEESIYDPILKAWQGWVDFSSNDYVVKKAKDGKFNGFSVEGFGIRVQKAVEESFIDKIKKSSEQLISRLEEISKSEIISDIDKRGNVDLEVSLHNDLVNKEIDSIFNIDNEGISKAQNQKSTEEDMDENKVMTIVNNCLREHEDRKAISKAESDKEKEISDLKTENEDRKTEIAELKKAIAGNKQPKSEGETKEEIEKGAEDDNGVF